jgi:hypothetical protein
MTRDEAFSKRALNVGQVRQHQAHKRGRLAREIADMADAQRRLGMMDDATYEKIMARHPREKIPPAK